MPLNVDYEAVLADLKQRKAELENGIAAIRRIAARFGAIPAEEAYGENTTIAVLRFLSDRRLQSFYAYEIADAIGCRKLGNVRGAIYRRVKMGTLRKDEDGRVRFLG